MQGYNSKTPEKRIMAPRLGLWSLSSSAVSRDGRTVLSSGDSPNTPDTSEITGRQQQREEHKLAVCVCARRALGQRVKVEPEVLSYPGQSVNLRCAFNDPSGIQLTQWSSTKDSDHEPGPQNQGDAK
ncbi:unnamed protein product [Merluccius merluccius]